MHKLSCFFVLVAISLVIGNISLAQTSDLPGKRPSISGIITDAHTHETLAGAYVYIEGTRIGAKPVTTGATGCQRLRAITLL